jgi:predicted MPP superfamily phosphohydrolase
MSAAEGLQLLLVIGVTAGHLLLVRELLARLYRLAMPWLLWLAVFVLLLASCVIVPWFFVRYARPDHPVLWQSYIAVCLGALLASTISRLRARKDPALLAERGEVVDVAARLGHRPAGTGARSWLARAPGNELFKVEIADREIVLPNLPPALDGLSVLHLTDLHFNGTPGRAFFERALDLAADLKPDLVALTGDILDRHARSDWLPTTLAHLHAPLGRYFVLGNHDALDEPDRIRVAMRDLGWTDVGGRSVIRDHNDHALVIAGTERPWLGRQPDLPNGQLRPALRLLLSHTPEQFAWAQSRDVDLVLAGHLHGGQIDLPLFGPVSGGRYHAGVFSAGNTVMHVSRGLGVMFPVRLNCPAEITRLILRSRPVKG